MSILAEVAKIAADCGFFQSGCIDSRRLQYHADVRRICEGNSCRNYGASWACPPAVGTLAQCRARVERFGTMMLFSKKYDLAESFDFEAMGEGLRDFKKCVDTFHRRLEPNVSDFLLLSNEGCGRCAECTYPEKPCRFPDLLHHSLEGYGFVVNELAKEAGMNYNNGPCTVTFFGALLFDP